MGVNVRFLLSHGKQVASFSTKWHGLSKTKYLKDMTRYHLEIALYSSVIHFNYKTSFQLKRQISYDKLLWFIFLFPKLCFQKVHKILRMYYLKALAFSTCIMGEEIILKSIIFISSPNTRLWYFYSLFKGHSRHLSHSRTGSDDRRLWNEIIHCTQIQRSNAHSRPITVLQTEGGRIVSGSQDFTLKVKWNSFWPAFKIRKLLTTKNSCNYPQMSHLMTKPTKWPVPPAKTQISLGIRPVWSESSLFTWVLNYLLSAQLRLIRLGRPESSLGALVILLVL